MHSVGQIDWSFMDRPAPTSATSSGIARRLIVGPEQGGLLSLNSPQRLDPSAPRRDTFFEPAQDLARMEADAMRPPFGDPTLRLVGHYDGTGPQIEALAVKDAARGRAPAGADTAILAYS